MLSIRSFLVFSVILPFENLRLKQVTPTTTYSTTILEPTSLHRKIKPESSHFSSLKQKSISKYFIKLSKELAETNSPFKPYHQYGPILYPFYPLRFTLKNKLNQLFLNQYFSEFIVIDFLFHFIHSSNTFIDFVI